MTLSEQRMGITEVLESIKDNAEGEDVELGEVVEHLENRGFGPILHYKKIKEAGAKALHQHSIDYLEPSTAIWPAFKAPLRW